jgi:hypothetical protein
MKKPLLYLFLTTFVFALFAQNTSLPVGAIPGVVDVSPMGAATYTIPIEVVPGTQGMQPNLSIVYNSFGGMGLLGMKWDIVGLSAITKTGQNPYFDNGNLTAVQFSSSDRFAIDGARLINISGNSYGTIGAIYATEIEDFTRVVSYNGAVGSPAYFKAYTDNGGIVEYGTANNSKQQLGSNSNTTLSWLISKITDVNGNYMTYHYGQTTSLHLSHA